MKKRTKYYLLMFSLLIIAIYMFYHYTFIKPVNVVNEILINTNENKLSYGLTPEQLKKINGFKDSSTQYGFPNINFNNEIDWKLSSRDRMAKKRIWIRENISLDKYIRYLGFLHEEMYNVDASVNYYIYDPKMEEGYTLIDVYNGEIYFTLRKTGFNKWEVVEINILNPLISR